MKRAKVGDLVRLTHSAKIGDTDLSDKTGIVTSVSIPSPTLPYQVAAIIFDDVVYDGIPMRMVEVINEEG